MKVNHVMGRPAARLFGTESLGINKPQLKEANSNYDSLTEGMDCTLKEFRELKLIEQGLELKDGEWHTVGRRGDFIRRWFQDEGLDDVWK